MRKTSQSKFLDQLDEISNFHELDLIVNKSYNNIGTVMFQSKDSYESIITIDFNFQPNAVTLRVFIGKRMVKSEYINLVHDGEKLGHLLDYINAHFESIRKKS